MKFKKSNRRKRIHLGIRKKIKGTVERPRLSVYRSNKEIYCQMIDDRNGNTLVAASSRDADLRGTEGTKLAEKAKAGGVESVVFDRNGYLYHGKIKALADGAREGGLKF